MCEGEIKIQNILGSSWTEAAQFRLGDLIQAIDGQTVHTRLEIFSMLEKAVMRGETLITVLRGDEKITLKLEL